MNPFRSVKVNLTLWYALILTVFLSVFAFLMVTELARALYRDADKNLAYETDTLEESLVGYLAPVSSPARLKQLVEAIRSWEKAARRLSRSILMIRFVNLDHAPLVSNLKVWEREIIFPDFERDSVFMEKGASFQTIHFQKMPIRLYYRLVRVRAKPLFIIQSGVSLRDVKNTLYRLGVIILITIPGAVVAACAAGWFLAKRSFQPLDLMIREARQITAAYLKGRLPRTRTGDELDRLAETLNEMIDRLESSTRAIQDFSSDISHELKTPLAIIRGEIDLALRRSRSPETVIQTLHVIAGEVNDLIRLVDDLLLLVRSDAKQLHFEKKRVSLRELLRQTGERFQERAQSKRIALAFHLDHDVFIEGDPIYIKRVLSNLLDNAVKFTPEGGRVTLGLKPQNGVAAVEVTDTGIGIASEMQGKVFSRFYRTDGARSEEGSGLGLNIAKAICEAHGGTIRLDSRPRRGTKVTLQFPLVP